MNYLLDTQAFIWMDSSSSYLSEAARQAIIHPENTLYLSVVSIWEMQIKHQLGKLQFRLPLPAVVEEQLRSGLQLLPISTNHVYELGSLPLRHRDPFDRLLIAQARVEDMLLISSDRRFAEYDVRVVWS